MVLEQLKTAFILRNETNHMAGYARFLHILLGFRREKSFHVPLRQMISCGRFTEKPYAN